MRKLLLPIIISSVLISSFANAASEEQIKEVIDKNENVLFKDQKAKEWGDTPDFIKLLTSKINVRKKSEGLSPFNVVWLKKVNEDPKNYQLSEKDQKWISSKIKESEDNKSSFWYPNGLTISEPLPVTADKPQTQEKVSEVKDSEPEKKTEEVKNPPVIETAKSDTKPVVINEPEKSISENKANKQEENPSWGNSATSDESIISTKEDKKEIVPTSSSPVVTPPKTEEVKVKENVTAIPKKDAEKAVEKQKADEEKSENTVQHEIKTTLPLQKATVSKNKADFIKKEQSTIVTKKPIVVNEEKNPDVVKIVPVIIEDKKLNPVEYVLIALKLTGLAFVSAFVSSLISRRKVKNKNIVE